MMIDSMTKKSLHVSTDGTAGPYIMVPVGQLPDLRKLLDDNEIRYLVEENAISLNGSPEVAILDLGRRADAQKVQKILDAN